MTRFFPQPLSCLESLNSFYFTAMDMFSLMIVQNDNNSAVKLHTVLYKIMKLRA